MVRRANGGDLLELAKVAFWLRFGLWPRQSENCDKRGTPSCWYWILNCRWSERRKLLVIQAAGPVSCGDSLYARGSVWVGDVRTIRGSRRGART